MTLLGSEQVEQEGAEPSALEDLRDVPVSGTVSTAATAMSEYDQPDRPGRQVQVPWQHDHSGRDLHVGIDPSAGRATSECGLTRTPVGTVEQDGHLVVARRREVHVVLPDGQERFGCRDADDGVSIGEPPQGVGRSNGHSQHDLRSTELPRHLTRHPRGRPGRHPVVDDERHTSLQVEARTTAAQARDARVQHGALHDVRPPPRHPRSAGHG